MTVNYDGSDLMDATGEKIGSIDRTYLDDAGAPRFVAVKVGSLLSHHYLVPADQAEESDSGIQVPFMKAVIEESPSVDTGDTLEGDQLGAIRSYYDNNGSISPESTQTGDDTSETDQLDAESISAIGEANPRNRPASDFPETQTSETPVGLGEIRDLGDVIEIPIVEEIMVKKPIVREVLRIRKSHLAETGMASADLRSERVEVIPSEDGLLSEQQEEIEGVKVKR